VAAVDDPADGPPEQVRAIVPYETVRFRIEVFFRVLQSGGRVEARHFEKLDRRLPCVAIDLIVAGRTLLRCRLGRSCPDRNGEAVFDPSEGKAVWRVTQRSAPPAEPPPRQPRLHLIAELGGDVNRTGRKDPPGPPTVWRGLQRLRDLAWAWNAFGPGATTEPGGGDV
jgi:hypothetical protein